VRSVSNLRRKKEWRFNMDPTTNLRELLLIAKEIDETHHMTDEYTLQNGPRLAELVLALDEWIKKGGFMPAQWAKKEVGR
jgi:hypothetical protein